MDLQGSPLEYGSDLYSVIKVSCVVTELELGFVQRFYPFKVKLVHKIKLATKLKMLHKTTKLACLGGNFKGNQFNLGHLCAAGGHAPLNLMMCFSESRSFTPAWSRRKIFALGQRS